MTEGKDFSDKVLDLHTRRLVIAKALTLCHVTLWFMILSSLIIC